jgi:hypothetical protein
MCEWVEYQKAVRMPIGFARPTVHIAESYFAESGPTDAQAGARVDVLACLYTSAPIKGWRNYRGSTRTIDLTVDPDQIFSAFSRSNRNNIKLAGRRDGTKTEIHLDPTDAELEEFFAYYDEFAASKGIPHIHREQLRALGRAGRLVLSTAHGPDETILAAHAYILQRDRARLTHSASLFRRQDDSSERGRIGRANRILHWNDMLFFRELQTTSYDLGGWYTGTKDEGLSRINSFKREFGGDVVAEWNSFFAASTLGSIYLAARALVRRLTD